MLVVQKYGGSSVGTPDRIKNVAQRIVKTRQAGHGVVVVVSAMGDTTDELIELARQVTSSSYEREMDMLLSAGERISMALLSMALRDLGENAISFTGSQAGIITDESHTRARILEIRPIRVREELAKNRIVIVAGFQGVSRNKEITTLGRGGSDTTAVALAAALAAERCEVLTDVPGIFSADPRIVPEAVRYETLPLDLVFEMAVRGAQVMHARSIEIARQAGFPIYVGHSSGQGGTMIVSDADGMLELPKVVAVTSKDGLSLLRFDSAQAAGVLELAARDAVLVHALDIDSAGDLRLAVHPSESTTFLAHHQSNVVAENLSAISVIGYQLQQNTQIPAKIAALLKEKRIPLVGLTCQHSSITVLVSGQNPGEVVRLLHNAFI